MDRFGVDAMPLSAAQRDILLASEVAGADSYWIARYLEIRGTLDEVTFQGAVRRCLDEAHVFHTRVTGSGSEFRHSVESLADWVLPIMDFVGDPDPQAAVQNWMAADVRKPVTITDFPLWHFCLIRLGTDHYYFYQRAHHIICDGFASAVFARRAAEIYTGLVNDAPGTPTPFGPYAELLTESADYRSSPMFLEDRQYWADHVSALARPARGEDMWHATGAPGMTDVAELTSSEADELIAAVRQAGHGWQVGFLAAAAVYVSKARGIQDMLIGVPVHSRTGRMRSRQTPGMLSNILPLRVEVHAEESFATLMRRISKELRAGLRRQRYRYEDMQRDLRKRNLELPHFDAKVNVMSFDTDFRFGGARAVERILATGPIDSLVVSAYNRYSGSGLTVAMTEVDPASSQVELGVQHQRFLRILKTAVTRPSERIGAIQVLSEAERHQVLVEWNDTGHQVPAGCLPGLFEARVARTPDAVAVVFGDVEVSYGELNVRVNRLARYLIGCGVGPERLVGVVVGRSVEMMVALLAVVKAGGAYVPIDPEYPPERVRFMLDDARLATVLTTSELSVRLSGLEVPTVLLDDPETLAGLEGLAAGDVADGERVAPLRPGNPAYVIYTSGSTGAPKGVVVSHRSLLNRLAWMPELQDVSARDRFLQKTPTSFDVSVWELFVPLVIGARLVVCRPGEHRDPAALSAVIARHGVTVAHFVPSMLRGWLADPSAGDCGSLRRVICSGEALTADLCADFSRRSLACLTNLYGPTEATVDVTWWDQPAEPVEGIVPIGRPVWNTRVYVLDRGLSPVPVGVRGELYVAGARWRGATGAARV